MSPARLGLLGARGFHPLEREGSSISWPRGAAVPRGRSRSAQGEGEERQKTCRETSLRTRICSETREGEGTRETKALPAGVARGVGSRQPPPAHSLQRLLHTRPFPSLLSGETQSRQEATSVHVFISHSVRLWLQIRPFFLDVAPEIEE